MKCGPVQSSQGSCFSLSHAQRPLKVSHNTATIAHVVCRGPLPPRTCTTCQQITVNGSCTMSVPFLLPDMLRQPCMSSKHARMQCDPADGDSHLKERIHLRLLLLHLKARQLREPYESSRFQLEHRWKRPQADHVEKPTKDPLLTPR
jgi:hypothetical protein